MKVLLSLIISFQFISLPVQAGLGEKESFKITNHLVTTLAETNARDFETMLRTELEKVQTQGIEPLAQAAKIEDPYLKLLNKRMRPIFKEKKKAYWVYTTEGHTIEFSSLDLYEGKLKINGSYLSFKNVPLKDLESQAEKIFSKKTSLFKKLYNESFGIQDAEACELICAAVALVIVVAIVGTAVYQLMIKPEKIVKRLNEMKQKLEADANSCEEAKHDPAKYQKTFDLVNTIAKRSPMGEVTSPSEALEYAMKQQFSSGERKNEDCFKLMNEVGKKVDIDIRIPTNREIQTKEITGQGTKAEKVDVASAAFNLCASYNRLGSCMENFVTAHVNDSDIESFKDNASPSHYKYQRKMRASHQ